jgi:trigger factor
LEITTEPLERCQLRLTIKVDEERAQKAMRHAARRIAKQVNIPGFRKGKAPYELIVQRYGEDTVRQEAAEALAEPVCREVLEQEEIEPYAPVALESIELHPVTFKFTISLPPTVDLGDYRDYRLKPRKVRVYKKEMQQALEQLREQNVILEPVERPATLGDRVEIDLVGRTADEVEFLKGDNIRVLLDAENTEPAPGFVEAILKMEGGEERTFILTLPDDFPREELRGHEAEFTVKMVKVYESTLPELDDDLARTVGNFDSLKELEQHVKEQLRQAAQQKADEEYTAQVLKDLLEQSQVEYPTEMLEKELDKAVKEVEQAVQRETRLPLEDYLRFQSQTMEELREDLKPRATAQLKHALVLGKVVGLEGLEIDEEEIDAHIEKVSAPWGARADEMRASLNSPEGRRAARSRLLTDKAVQRLVAIARGEADRQEAEGTGAEGE